MVLSEPDKGIYDAMNKGLAKASGNWICFLSADDYYVSDDVLQNLSQFIDVQPPNINFVSARINLIDNNEKILRSIGLKFSKEKMFKKFIIAHPGACHCQSLFKQVGKFNIAYRSSADYEWFLRAADLIVPAFQNSVIVNMREGGISNSLSWKVLYKMSKETYRVQYKYCKISAARNFLLTNLYFFIDRVLHLQKIRIFMVKLIKDRAIGL